MSRQISASSTAAQSLLMLLCYCYPYTHTLDSPMPTCTRYTLNQLRTASNAGGVRTVILRAHGAAFSIHAVTLHGDETILVDTHNKKPRQFIDPRQAMTLLGKIGINKAEVDTSNWHPEQASELRKPRPDRAVQMKAAHEAAEIKRMLEERIRQADNLNAVWHDADSVFAELEALHAD